MRANDAVVGALAPVCSERFQRVREAEQPSRRSRRPTGVVVTRVDETEAQGAFVERGGWAAMRGTSSPDRVTAIAKARAASSLVV
jgi:hypothetical protein